MKRLTKKEKRERMARIVSRLEERYPEVICALEYEGDPWKLLVMGRLSAQCTDARVNIACRDLFTHFPTAEALAYAPLEAVEGDVRQCGLYHVKAQNIIDASRMLVEEFGGVLPRTMEEMLRFPGVGRKVANLVLGDVYRIPGVVTDTHCIRICGRLGMYPEAEKSPPKIEKILAELIEPDKQTDFCHRIVWFGREVCSARAPACDTCPLGDLCRHKESVDGKTKN
ncbi:MAG: endonuclease III [Clostridia bacterium]|nr:endonuclease III [Clostridia bacterium]